MVADGLSATAIARTFGGDWTRNMVLAKAFRLGLTLKGHRWVGKDPMVSPPKPKPTRQAVKTVREKKSKEIVQEMRDQQAPEPVNFEPDPNLVSRYSWPPSGCCKWPIGDPQEADFRFCGHKTENILAPYCPHHMVKAVDAAGAIRLARKIGLT
jgi:GcrA cell cycle regulator